MTPKSNKKNGGPRQPVLMALGEKIREMRHRQGYTQAALAEALDLSVAYVSLIERGGRNPPFTTVMAIARALGVAPAKLLE